MSRLTVDEAAEYARRHPNTIRRLLEAKDLHGSQPKKGGRWLVAEECIDAYLNGTPCAHKQNVTELHRRRAS